MKNITFLLPEGSLKPASLFGAIEVFEKANEFYLLNGAKPYYQIHTAGAAFAQGLLNGQFYLQSPGGFSNTQKTDLIVVPPLHESMDYQSKGNKEMLEWMVQQYKAGAELASLCTGAFFLAASGLLKGKECSTHWKAEKAFIKLYPDVKLRTDKIITDNKGIYTAGGANSSLNLILYLVEKYNGRETALYCAKVLQIDIDRSSQAPFMLFEGQKDHDDEEIRKVQSYIEQNIEDRISVESLADKFIMSRRNFIRRFKKATNNAPIEYIQRVKMEAAKRSLETTRKNVNEVMYSVGYTDMKAFRTIFKKVTGLTPVEYKVKFSNL